ncbi:hypothetical protein VULLAG_LOCUS10741 [Vulpes lagopus]
MEPEGIPAFLGLLLQFPGSPFRGEEVSRETSTLLPRDYDPSNCAPETWDYNSIDPTTRKEGRNQFFRRYGAEFCEGVEGLSGSIPFSVLLNFHIHIS